MERTQFYLSPELAPRLAAIDIGTNSIRLIVAEAQRGSQYRVLDDEKETTRLGAELSSTGRLPPAAVEQSLEALRRMKQIVDGYQVNQLRVIGTCALREAADGPEFCRRARDEIGLEIEVISAKTEAHLAFLSVCRSFDLRGKNVAVADIGGGSTEIVLASGTFMETVCPTPLGAVRLTEMFGQGQMLDDATFQAMVRHIDEVLVERTKKVLRPHLVIGSGGTFTTLAEMVLAEQGQSGLPLRGYEVRRADITHLLDALRKMSPKARRGVTGLSPDRADIIVAGIAIIERIMRRFKVNTVQVHDRGVRDGLLLTMIDDSLGAPSANTNDQEAAIERLSAACGCDLDHGRQVARLAGLMFSQLIDHFQLNVEDRRLLEAAARLQDVGYLINYEGHHKHSYHLILNSRLAGFNPLELELLANIARYHRGSLPKKKHLPFQQLSPRDQQRVWQMAGILRVAGGLDRSNTQRVKAVVVTVDKTNVRIDAVADENPEVDIWAARRRTEMFDKAFDRTVAIEWLDSHCRGLEASPPSASASGPPTPAPLESAPPHDGNGAKQPAVDPKPAKAP